MGGYCANNPTLYALADATQAFKMARAYPGREHPGRPVWRGCGERE